MEDMADLHMYSDGSGIEGMAGAATIVFRDGQEVKSVCYLLGPLTCHTTYEAEVVSVLLARELIHRKCSALSTTIRLDNQAIIQALGGRSTKPAQALLNLVHEGSNDWMTSDSSVFTGYLGTMGFMATSVWMKRPRGQSVLDLVRRVSSRRHCRGTLYHIVWRPYTASSRNC